MGVRLRGLALCHSDAILLPAINLLATRDLVANPIGLLRRSSIRLLFHHGRRGDDVEHRFESEIWTTPSQTKRHTLNVTFLFISPEGFENRTGYRQKREPEALERQEL